MPASSSHVRQSALDGRHRFHHALAVGVRGIDGEHVHFAAHQFLRALQKIAGRADRRAHAQTALLILGGIGIFQFFLNVLYGDQAFEVELIVDHQQFLDAVLVQDLLGLFERGAHRHGDRGFPWSSPAKSAGRSAIRSAGRDW